MDRSTLRVNRPMEVVVLNCWVTETNETPWASNSSTSLAKSANDLVRAVRIMAAESGVPPTAGILLQTANRGCGTFSTASAINGHCSSERLQRFLCHVNKGAIAIVIPLLPIGIIRHI